MVSGKGGGNMWIICDQGHAINLDHYTRLDWKKAEQGPNSNHYEVLAVRDFRHLGMVQRWDDKAKERDVKDTIVRILLNAPGWVAPEQRGESNGG
jgi:hypothetical protein